VASLNAIDLQQTIAQENFVGKPNWKQNPLIEVTGLGFKDSDQVITKP
jgi:hypothetical protein